MYVYAYIYIILYIYIYIYIYTPVDTHTHTYRAQSGRLIHRERSSQDTSQFYFVMQFSLHLFLSWKVLQGWKRETLRIVKVSEQEHTTIETQVLLWIKFIPTILEKVPGKHCPQLLKPVHGLIISPVKSRKMITSSRHVASTRRYRLCKQKLFMPSMAKHMPTTGSWCSC